MVIAKSLFYFVLAGLCEIGGRYRDLHCHGHAVGLADRQDTAG